MPSKRGFLPKRKPRNVYQRLLDNFDSDKDGKITREEWDAIQKYISEGKNTAFASGWRQR